MTCIRSEEGWVHYTAIKTRLSLWKVNNTFHCKSNSWGEIIDKKKPHQRHRPYSSPKHRKDWWPSFWRGACFHIAVCWNKPHLNHGREKKYMPCLWKVTISQHSDAESVFLIIQAFFSLVYLISNLYMCFFSDKRYLCFSSHCQICEHRGQDVGTQSFILIFIRAWMLLLLWHASNQELCILIDN